MIPENWIAFPTGILIATVVSAIGLGGGILWMPFFLIVMKLRPETAVITSLFIQTAGMASGSVAFFMQKKVDVKLALIILAIAFPGIMAGACLANILSSHLIEVVLGVMVMMTAFVFVSTNEKYTELGEPKADYAKIPKYSWVPALSSVVSGMLSISMSEWLIPVMRSKLSLKMSGAIATCIVIALGTCLMGSAIHLLMGGKANFSIVMFAVPGVLIGGQIGPRITTRINERLLKEIFIFLLTLVGIHLIYNSF